MAIFLSSPKFRFCAAHVVSTFGERLSFGAALIHFSLLLGVHGPVLMLTIWSLGFVIAYPVANRILGSLNLYRILICGDFVRAVVLLLYLFSFIIQSKIGAGVFLAIIMTLLVFITAAYRPAQWAAIPLLAGESEILQLNRFMTVSNGVALAVGTVAGGAFVVFFPIYWIYVFDAFTYIVSFSILANADIKRSLTRAAPKQARPSLRMFLGEIQQNLSLKKIFLIATTISIVVGVFSGIMVSNLQEKFALPKQNIGYTYGLSAVASIFGSYAIIPLIRILGCSSEEVANKIIAYSSVVCTFALFMMPNYPLALLVLFVASALSTHTSIWCTSDMMTECHPEKRATVASTNTAIARAAMFIGSAAAPLFSNDYFVLICFCLCLTSLCYGYSVKMSKRIKETL